MKLVKTAAIAFAMSAVLAGAVLAQGVSSDAQIRSGMQGRGNLQGGISGIGEVDLNAQTGMSSSGVNPTPVARGPAGTVGSGAPPGIGMAAPAAGARR
jgi:hypothetical protein